MILIIACVVLVVGILLCIFTRYEGWGSVGIFAAAAALVVALLVPVSLTPTGMYSSPDTETEERALISLGNDSETKGSFFLGTGTVEEDQVYVYLVDTNLGAEMKTVKVSNARIVEGGGEPRIEYWRLCDLTVWLPWPACSRPILVFHIPPGSISREFTIAP